MNKELEQLIAENDDLIKRRMEAIKAFKAAHQVYQDIDAVIETGLEDNWESIREVVEDNGLDWPYVAGVDETLIGAPLKVAFAEDSPIVYKPSRLKETQA